jgi:phosphatidylglycerophosphatase A
MSQPSANLPTTTTPSPSDFPHREQRKPRVSLAIATAFGLGYLPKAPGTWGSIAGLFLSWLLLKLWPHITLWEAVPRLWNVPIPYGFSAIAATLSIGFIGIVAADRYARYLNVKDPQVVVVDEVSGQMIATLFTVGTTERYLDGMTGFHSGFWWHGDPNWKYLLLGFILFRVFDIWKPFPARQAESLPGGWGIMADDWIAGIYAALGLWIARALGL